MMVSGVAGKLSSGFLDQIDTQPRGPRISAAAWFQLAMVSCASIFVLKAITMAAVLWSTLGHSQQATREQFESSENGIMEVMSGISHIALRTGEYSELQPYLVNLLEDALKFSRESSAPEIRISASEQDGRVVVSIEDNGIGIESHYREQISGLFNRLNQSYEGTGIGLVLVKPIVEVHGGSVRVESGGSGRVACFRFTLPALPRVA